MEEAFPHVARKHGRPAIDAATSECVYSASLELGEVMNVCINRGACLYIAPAS